MSDRPPIYDPLDSSMSDKVVRRACGEIGEARLSHADVCDFSTFMKHLSSAVAHGMNEEKTFTKKTKAKDEQSLPLDFPEKQNVNRAVSLLVEWLVEEAKKKEDCRT